MAEHHEEMEQIEALKRWWLENRAFVVAGLVLGVAVVAGWRGWEWHVTRQAEQASALYEKLTDAVEADDAALAAELVKQLVDGYATTPYAANAALLKAKLDHDAGDRAGARSQLEWVVAHAADGELKVLARVRLARVLIADGQAAAAVAQLAGQDGGAFRGLLQDALGDAHAALGDREAARAAWRAALDASDGNLADRDLIALKLEALGPAPAAAPAAAPASGSTP